MAWIELISYRGWKVRWDSATGKMYASENSLLGRTHHFKERTKDRATAVAIAKAWIDEHG